MKTYFFLKLAIGILVVFGLAITGMLIYRPLWFRVTLYRLESDNPETRGAAIAALAEQGKRAMGHLDKWLQSGRDRRVTGSCLVLDRMKGDVWKEALPALEQVLLGKPSVTVDAAVELLDNRSFSWTTHYENVPKWMMRYVEKNGADPHRNRLGGVLPAFSFIPVPVRNVLCYRLVHARNPDIRRDIIRILGAIGDRRAIEPLIGLVRNDGNEAVRSAAALALGDIGGPRTTAVLLDAMEDDEYAGVRSAAAWALGKTGDRNTLKPLINAFAREEDEDARDWMARALRRLPDDFPHPDPLAGKPRREWYAKSMKKWIKENRARLTWDKGREQYRME